MGSAKTLQFSTNNMTQPSNGAILWEGNSLLDNSPIAIILTGLHLPSHNPKTGLQIQSWIIQQDYLPTDAIKYGNDTGTCGNCPLKPSCYIRPMGINNIWRKYRRGGYPHLDDNMLNRIKRRHQSLRIGSYGEGTAAPFEIWQPLLSAAANNTGYTHQWRSCDRRWARYLMASIENPKDIAKANAMGWRTFRTILSLDFMEPGEMLCRNAQDKDITCEECRLCCGTNGTAKTNIATPVHGLNWKIQNFKAIVANFKD